MKEIRLFIENTSAPYLKHILILYGCVLILQPIATFLNVIGNSDILMSLILYGSFIALFIIHRKRFRMFMHKGGLTRIRLLPLRKTTFLYSELIFQFMTYLGLLCVNIITWLILYYMLLDKQPFLEHSYLFYMLSNNTSATYVPLTWNILLFDVFLLINIACISVFLLLGNDSDKSIVHGFLYVGAILLILFINWTCKLELHSMKLNEILPVLSVLVLLPLHPCILKSSFLWKRRKTK